MNNKRKLKQSGIKLAKKGLLGTAESNAVFKEGQRRQMQDEQQRKVKDFMDSIEYRAKIDPDLAGIFDTLREMNNKIEEILSLLKKTRKGK
jgi:hypothetical protein